MSTSIAIVTLDGRQSEMTSRYHGVDRDRAGDLLRCVHADDQPNSSDQAAHAPSRDAAAPIVLPELSGLAESVQQQIRERKRELDQTLERPGASRPSRRPPTARLDAC